MTNRDRDLGEPSSPDLAQPMSMGCADLGASREPALAGGGSPGRASCCRAAPSATLERSSERIRVRECACGFARRFHWPPVWGAAVRAGSRWLLWPLQSILPRLRWEGRGRAGLDGGCRESRRKGQKPGQVLLAACCPCGALVWDAWCAAA